MRQTIDRHKFQNELNQYQALNRVLRHISGCPQPVPPSGEAFFLLAGMIRIG
jgi:hypothetical protein